MEKRCVYFPEKAVIPVLTEKIEKKKKRKKNNQTKKQAENDTAGEACENVKLLWLSARKHGIMSANTLVQGKYQAIRVDSSAFSKYRFETFSEI